MKSVMDSTRSCTRTRWWWSSSFVAFCSINSDGSLSSTRPVQIGEFIPDLIAFAAVIVDTKVIDRITAHERGQMINYLRITKLRVGLILNFKHSRLEWDRVVL